MKVKDLKILLEKAEPESLVLLRVLDNRGCTPHITAWVDDNGILVIEGT